MDELDRLFGRLVQNIRAGFPDHLTHQFEAAELYQSLVPYRHNRREIQIETNQDYELAMMRLLSGERGYVLGDATMQESLRNELASPNPDTTAFREFAMTLISIAPDAIRTLDHQPLNAPPARPTGAARASSSVGAPPIPRQSVAPVDPPPASPPPRLRASAAASAPAPIAPRTTTPGSRAASTTGCRYCGGALPEGRSITFCPHCGQNLTVQQCPACSTELEMGWKFCTTCGRAVGA